MEPLGRKDTTMDTLHCDHCGQVIVPDGVIAGYGTTPEGQRLCYDCCAWSAGADMVRHGDTVLYLTGPYNDRDSTKTWKVTNWPGTLIFRPTYVSKGRHNMAGTRYDVWFCGPDGHEWHGINIGDNEILRCKRTKRTR